MVEVPVLVINGPVGSGKSTVLGELSDLLLEVGVAHTAIDLDALSQTFPRPADDVHMMKLALRNLASIWENASQVGSERLLVASVVESQDDLDAIVDRIPNGVPFACRLDASVAELHRRLRAREIGSARDWHIDRASELSTILSSGIVDDIVIDTTRKPVRDIGIAILVAARWPHPTF